MPITIGNNIASILAQRRLSEHTEAVSRSFERLSSGMRINRASDDAAGLAIAATLEADSRIFSQAIRNVNDAVSSVNIATAALSQFTSIVTRQLELAQQAANGSYSTAQRRALDREANALVDEYNRIGASVKFNGVNILNQAMTIQAGAGAQAMLQLDLGSIVADDIGTGQFLGSTDIAGGTSVGRAINSADMNGDGHDDIVTGNWTDNTVSILISNGNGTFLAPLSIGVGGNAGPVHLVDMNHDGALDIVTRGVSGVQPATATILGNGNGTFLAPQYSQTGGTYFFEFDMSDFNNDGHLDFVGGHGQLGVGNGLVVMLGDGTGRFTTPRTFGSNLHYSIHDGDFDGDGNRDIFANDGTLGNATVYFGNGDGTFVPKVVVTTPPHGNVLDVNRDGYTDVVQSNAGTTIQIYYGSANRTFTLGSTTYNLVNASDQVLTLGVNGDGWEDLVTTNAGGHGNVLFNRGDGTFSAAQSINLAAGTYDAAVGDVRGDGAPDLLLASLNANGIRIIEQDGSRTVYQEHFSLLTRYDALAAMESLQTTLDTIGMQIALVGAQESRLVVANEALAASQIAYASAVSRITDVDVAAETAELTRRSILQNVTAAILAQANSKQNLALELLTSLEQ